LSTISKKIKIQNGSPNWTKNATRFESVPMTEVFKELERQFDISVNTKKVSVNPIFTGAFEHTDIEKALITITEPLDLKFTINPNNEIIVYE
jgi:ferric-dicitrate binding protein FerR (iron transport regulator)